MTFVPLIRVSMFFLIIIGKDLNRNSIKNLYFLIYSAIRKKFYVLKGYNYVNITEYNQIQLRGLRGPVEQSCQRDLGDFPLNSGFVIVTRLTRGRRLG